MADEPTPYEVLGIHKRATASQVAAAWARCLREAKHDPERQAEVNAARDALDDPPTRASIDVHALNYPLELSTVPRGLEGVCWPGIAPQDVWLTALEVREAYGERGHRPPLSGAGPLDPRPEDLQDLADELQRRLAADIDPWEE